MADIFISYARADRDKIEKLASALESEGYSVWWDRQIVGGSEFSKDIERELDAAKVVIVAWSAAGNESPWVKDEASTAREQGKLIPVRLDETKSPMGFRQYQAIEFASWRGDAHAPAFDQLARAIKMRLSGEAQPAPIATKASWTARLLKPAPLAAIGAVAVFIIGGGVWMSRSHLSSAVEETSGAISSAAVEKKDQTPEADPASIAVLPFTDLSPEGDQQYFSDGIAEEILNVLVQVNGLKVASRTSSFAFKGQETIGMPVIAKSLHVRNVLEGSVRKAGDQVRITAQLINGETDQHLWSGTYDRTLTAENIFAIQDEIAQAIVSALDVRLRGGEEGGQAAVSAAADTGNLDAYELYLKAHGRFIERGPPEYYAETIKMFERATEIDPGFARAWAGLAAAASIADIRGVEDRDYQSIARSAAERALALNPDMSLAYAALGEVELRAERPNFEQIFQYFDAAIDRDSHDATAYHWRSIVWRQLGFMKKAEEDAMQCLVIDPSYQNCKATLETINYYRGDLEQGMKLHDEMMLTGYDFINADYQYNLVRTGNREALLKDIMDAVYTDGGDPWMVEPIFKAYTDPEYDKKEGYRQFKARMQAQGFKPVPMSDLDLTILHAFGAYEDMHPRGGLFYWSSSIPAFVASPERNRLVREVGIYDYWLKHGFPPQCRPVGADDFECD